MDWRRILAAWVDFFLGCPRRTLILLAVGLGLYLVMSPVVLLGLVAHVMNNVVSPLFQGLVPWFVLLVLGMWFWGWGKSKGKGGGKKGGK